MRNFDKKNKFLLMALLIGCITTCSPAQKQSAFDAQKLDDGSVQNKSEMLGVGEPRPGYFEEKLKPGAVLLDNKPADVAPSRPQVGPPGAITAQPAMIKPPAATRPAWMLSPEDRAAQKNATQQNTSQQAAKTTTWQPSAQLKQVNATSFDIGSSKQTFATTPQGIANKAEKDALDAEKSSQAAQAALQAVQAKRDDFVAKARLQTGLSSTERAALISQNRELLKALNDAKKTAADAAENAQQKAQDAQDARQAADDAAAKAANDKFVLQQWKAMSADQKVQVAKDADARYKAEIQQTGEKWSEKRRREVFADVRSDAVNAALLKNEQDDLAKLEDLSKELSSALSTMEKKDLEPDARALIESQIESGRITNQAEIAAARKDPVDYLQGKKDDLIKEQVALIQQQKAAQASKLVEDYIKSAAGKKLSDAEKIELRRDPEKAVQKYMLDKQPAEKKGLSTAQKAGIGAAIGGGVGAIGAGLGVGLGLGLSDDQTATGTVQMAPVFAVPAQ